MALTRFMLPGMVCQNLARGHVRRGTVFVPPVGLRVRHFPSDSRVFPGPAERPNVAGQECPAYFIERWRVVAAQTFGLKVTAFLLTLYAGACYSG